jgi:hypothetical protein
MAQPFQPTSKEDKILYAETFASRADDIDAYPDIVSMGKGMFGCAYLSLRTWAKEDAELNAIFQRALYLRASAYLARAHKAADIPEFWEQPNLDMSGRVVLLTRERISAVNKAKAQIEHWRWCAAKMTPDLYGDYSHQLKEQDNKIKAMQLQLDDFVNKK